MMMRPIYKLFCILSLFYLYIWFSHSLHTTSSSSSSQFFIFHTLVPILPSRIISEMIKHGMIYKNPWLSIWSTIIRKEKRNKKTVKLVQKKDRNKKLKKIYHFK